MEIILYSTGCPKCNILTKKLDEKHLNYKTIDDEKLMLEKGLTEVPWLEVEGNMMNFSTAVKWVNNL